MLESADPFVELAGGHGADSGGWPFEDRHRVQLPPRVRVPPHWLSHVRVENLDETIEKAKSVGGKLAAGPFEMGEVGRIAIVADPQGAHISAYQPERDGPGSEGVFVWDELATTDADDAQRFYGEVCARAILPAPMCWSRLPERSDAIPSRSSPERRPTPRRRSRS
ncbi:MAG: hypothetical protein M3O73_02760 [Actinomycetota bacterium]|nr:hypothetical protein [Actinomycetota bacterium]